MRCYTYRKSKLERACIEGMRLEDDGRIFLDARRAAFLWLPPLDGGTEKEWGRLVIEADFLQGSTVRVYAAAGEEKEKITQFLLDSSVKTEQKQAFFSANGTAGKTCRRSSLLYGHKGRYLWLGIEVRNVPQGCIEKIQVRCPGDIFMGTFPQVYRENGGTLHRYLSVFSSVYDDFREESARIWEMYNPDKAGSRALASIGEWFGIHMGEGLLSEEEMRTIAGSAHRLIQIKGTPAAVREVTELLTKEKPLIVEKDNGDVTLLLERKLTEDEELRLLFFLRQFVPAYSRLNILSYGEENGMDGYCFADINARIPRFEEGALDAESPLDICVSG